MTISSLSIRTATDRNGVVRACIRALRAAGLSDASILERAARINAVEASTEPRVELHHGDITETLTVACNPMPPAMQALLDRLKPTWHPSGDETGTLFTLLANMAAYDWHGLADAEAQPANATFDDPDEGMVPQEDIDRILGKG